MFTVDGTSKFFSPTDGIVSLNEMVEVVRHTLLDNIDKNFKIMIGTDSQRHGDFIKYSQALILHKIGKGGRYFHREDTDPIPGKIMPLKKKIFTEVGASLELATEIYARLEDLEAINLMEVHIDVGAYGETKALIREVTGMIVGGGFTVRIKPDSCAASSVADRHSK